MEKSTYLIQYENDLHKYPCEINPRGFTYNEASHLLKQKVGKCIFNQY